MYRPGGICAGLVDNVDLPSIFTLTTTLSPVTRTDPFWVDAIKARGLPGHKPDNEDRGMRLAHADILQTNVDLPSCFVLIFVLS